MPDAKGYFSLVLHSHIPFVIGHGRWPHGMDWLNEAAAETYIPLLMAFQRLVEEGMSPQITIGITPILGEQLADSGFKEEFQNYLNSKIEAARLDRQQFNDWGQESMMRLAEMWESTYQKVREYFTESIQQDITGAFARLQDQGHIEIITCAATHGYLPLLSEDTSIQAQIRMGVKAHWRLFGRQPEGIWLPEAAYRPGYRWRSPLADSDTEATDRPGVESFLTRAGLKYFIIDSHLLRGGQAVGVYVDRFAALKQLWGQFEKSYTARPEDFTRTPYSPYWVGDPGGEAGYMAVFTRDPETGVQVWSGEHGYPGDGNYLDFHKKHFPGGHRYWKVTGPKADLAEKLEYDPEAVEGRLTENADHFVSLIGKIAGENQDESGPPPVICAPYDTELFGHWWFEGPRWIYHVIRGLYEKKKVLPLTCGRYLEQYPPAHVISLPEGSWGKGGFHWIWLNEWTEWTWRHIYDDEAVMKQRAVQLAESKDDEIVAILSQMARELLLLQSSDWQFLISTWSARDYAENRIGIHHENFERLTGLLDKRADGNELSAEDKQYLDNLIAVDRPFPDLELAWWARLEGE
ncbi:glycoside hydrolase family 57 protein [candidate division KSB1 bacterium]